MQTKRSLRTALLALAACALTGLASPSRAEIYFQQISFDLFSDMNLDVVGPGGFHSVQSKMFQYWNPANAPLKAARWELYSAWAFGTTTVVASHATDSKAEVTGGLQVGIGLATRGSGGEKLKGTGGQYFADHDEATGSCTTTLASGGCDFAIEQSHVFTGTIEATDLDAFVGIGEFTQGISIMMELFHSLDGSGEIHSSALYRWADLAELGGRGKLRLVYEFDYPETPDDEPGNDVPEPSTLLLSLAGLGIATAHRRVLLQRRA